MVDAVDNKGQPYRGCATCVIRLPPLPRPALLFCPFCRAQHIDVGEWATRPHHKHLCAVCGEVWRVEPYCYGVAR